MARKGFKIIIPYQSYKDEAKLRLYGNFGQITPIKFNNLDEYVEFMKWQRQVGIKCPVLYLQHTYDAQNNLGWRPLNDPLEPNAGMLTGPMPGTDQETLLYDANRLDPPYNEADFPAYDPQNQYIGDTTPLDKMFNEINPPSNPMDTGYVSDTQMDALKKWREAPDQW